MAVADPTTNVPRLDLELNSGCDHRCGHCYNVWNATDSDYPRGTLPTDDYLAMVERLVAETGADHITVTGGEPLVRKDAMRIIERVCSLVRSVQLITNGSHVGPERAARFADFGLRSVQLTLLSGDRTRHDTLKGAVCFDDTLRAALDLRDAGVPVQVCFVAMRENWQDFEDVVELCAVLGVRAISYNRMSPTGWAVDAVERLMPTVEHVEHNLATAERLARALGIRVATAMPIPPCLIRMDRYPWVQFGLCSTGTQSPNIVVDPLGNIRSCNLSSHIMGNAKESAWTDIYADAHYRNFRSTVPEVCRGCAYERSCQGGCKESGLATYGDLRHPEPFLQQALTGSVAGGLVQITESRR